MTGDRGTPPGPQLLIRKRESGRLQYTQLPRAVEEHHATDVLPIAHVLVSLVDVAEFVCLGDKLVEQDTTVAVVAQYPRDVDAGVGGSEQCTDDLTLVEGGLQQRNVSLQFFRMSHRRDHDPAQLPGQRQSLAEVGALGDIGGHDDLVCQLTTGHLADQFTRL